MKVLVACEFSGVVRDAFSRLGHDAMSCDLMDSESPGPHYKGDVFDVLYQGWDMVLAFPPCTYLCSSGARWFRKRRLEQSKAVKFVSDLWSVPCSRMCVENPVGVLSTQFLLPTQIIQPWQFGHGETKRTCLWLRGLPPIVPTEVVTGREAKIHKMSPGPNRSKDRSRTYRGIAEAMAQQWGV